MVAKLMVQVIIYSKLFVSFKVHEEFLAVRPAPYQVPKIAPDPVHSTMQENNTWADSFINALRYSTSNILIFKVYFLK